MKFIATKKQVNEIVANAILASSPVGLGHLNYGFLTKEQLMDYFDEQDVQNTPEYYVDYYQGRMVKLNIYYEDGHWNIRTYDMPPRPDYQSWCRTYPTYKDLLLSVIEPENILDDNGQVPTEAIHKIQEDAPTEEKEDGMRDLCIQQGYVPPKCYLQGMLIYALVNKGEDPCAGCNLDRPKCGGRPKGVRA